MRPLVCLCLTGSTIKEDLEIAEKYRSYIDVVELRVDYLEENERLNIRNFPSLVKIPCILTIRRVIDGGKYDEGEGARTTLFARALSFVDRDSAKNFAYVDFEEDFNVQSLVDAAMAFGITIIRSVHDMKNPITNIRERVAKLRKTGYEIPKIAFMPHSLKDVTDFCEEAAKLNNTNQILCAMGKFGLPTRILAVKLNSFLTYTSPKELMENLASIGHIDPIKLCDLYRFRMLDKDTTLFGITGDKIEGSFSPNLHNEKYLKNNMNAVYIPFHSTSSADSFRFARAMGLKGFSVTIPHKETIIDFLTEVDKKVVDIGACNTVVNMGNEWIGYNTDCTGFERALLEFTELENLKGKKVSIIGAGGAAKAVAYSVKRLGAKACVFNRTTLKARRLAELYGFEYGGLDSDDIPKLKKYSDIIIQTTSVGMYSKDAPDENNDPIWFYDFTGKEMVYDVVYEPEITPIMARASIAGCKVHNGFTMLKYQGEEQFQMFKEAYIKSLRDDM
ncbi:MAG: type I 3-dehydroquinate dehydratase [Treponema sp.]|nr:type I 3-dehydroquinate dehydratase [Treponema sp.]